ncbi:MAG: hypothetical protein ACLP7Q_22875 [Isosphaeraceae bacterium]
MMFIAAATGGEISCRAPLEYTSISPVWAFKISVPLAKVGGAGAGGVGVGVEVVEPEFELEPVVVPELFGEVEPAEPVEVDVVEPVEVEELAGVLEVELGVVVGVVVGVDVVVVVDEVVVDVVVGVDVVVVVVGLCASLVDVELDDVDVELEDGGVELDDEGANETGHDWLVVGVPCAVPVVEDALDVDVAAGDDAGVCVDVGVDAFEAVPAGVAEDGAVVDGLVVLAAGVEVLPPTLV